MVVTPKNVKKTPAAIRLFANGEFMGVIPAGRTLQTYSTDIPETDGMCYTVIGAKFQGRPLVIHLSEIAQLLLRGGTMVGAVIVEYDRPADIMTLARRMNRLGEFTLQAAWGPLAAQVVDSQDSMKVLLGKEDKGECVTPAFKILGWEITPAKFVKKEVDKDGNTSVNVGCLGLMVLMVLLLVVLKHLF